MGEEDDNDDDVEEDDDEDDDELALDADSVASDAGVSRLVARVVLSVGADAATNPVGSAVDEEDAANPRSFTPP